jgi:hypothetical protein
MHILSGMTLFGTAAPSLRNVPPAPSTPESEFQQNLIALLSVERELADVGFAIAHFHARHPQRSRLHFQNGAAYVRLNALADLPPELRTLERQRDAILAERATLLAEHARLKIATRLAK